MNNMIGSQLTLVESLYRIYTPRDFCQVVEAKQVSRSSKCCEVCVGVSSSWKKDLDDCSFLRRD